MTTAALVLAAGAGSRFEGGRKLRATIGGVPLIRLAVDAARGAGLAETVVVVGDDDCSDLLPDDVTVVRNEVWAQGLATSLGAGCEWARHRGHDVVVVGLADQPGIPSEAWREVAGAPFPIAVATYDGVRGHPVRLAESVWPLLPATGDIGARLVMRSWPDLVGEVPCRGQQFDIDTVEDLDRWS